MRLVTFTLADNGDDRIGALIDDDARIVDLARAYSVAHGEDTKMFTSMLALIDSGGAGLTAAQTLVDVAPAEAVINTAAARLRSPLPRPRQMRDFMAFEGHARGAREVHFMKSARQKKDPAAAMAEYRRRGQLDPPPVWYEQPVYFKCNRMNVIGPDEDILYPSFTHELDYELELAFITGRKGKDIPQAEARDYIFGYTIYNDVSARDAQINEMRGQLGPAKGKDFDTGNILGPCIVTADEIGDPYDLDMRARLNGELLSQGNSADIFHSFERMIEHVSRDETIWPGEVFGSGTIGGGSGHEHYRLMEIGDEIELEVEKIGVLRNKVVAGG
jgi:2-keto-4-pentenoate hydratase/2-oxohepta-3-ene-1,7-dioic acid hydratase in catechol pathway